MANAKKPRKAPVFQDDPDDDYVAPAASSKPAARPATKSPGATRPAPIGVRETHYVDLDARSTQLAKGKKPTKKKDLEEWKGSQRGKTMDTFIQKQAEEARKKFGHTAIFVGDETTSLVVGIPIPALAFEYVIAQDCFPLGLLVQIVAKYGVGKSGLLAEIARWFDLAGGGLVLCENETKFNPVWYSSILGAEAYSRVLMHRCKSVEDWQRHMSFAIKQMQYAMIGTKEAPGPGRTIPMVFGVDSVMGKMSEESQEKILGKVGDAKKKVKATTGTGFAQARQHPVEAGSITKYMRTIPQLIDHWPFSIVLINHLRMKQDDNGNPERNKTGGEQMNFQESFELEIKKIGGHKKKIATADYEGVPLEISCEKNSFGPTGRKAQVRLLWWHELDEKGDQQQRTVWDWDWGTVHLLNNLMNGDNQSTYMRSRLKDIGFHLEIVESGDAENSAWSKSVGMKSEDAMSWGEVGALIREDQLLMQKLRDALCITRRPRLASNYMALKEQLSEDAS